MSTIRPVPISAANWVLLALIAGHWVDSSGSALSPVGVVWSWLCHGVVIDASSRMKTSPRSEHEVPEIAAARGNQRTRRRKRSRLDAWSVNLAEDAGRDNPSAPEVHPTTNDGMMGFLPAIYTANTTLSGT
ncbi:hypothetical protein F5888DRAFT_1736567 [Russula emetica]|nr:hypothetical protein F5888DRAFT_1736567 [Russula emetica]